MIQRSPSELWRAISALVSSGSVERSTVRGILEDFQEVVIEVVGGPPATGYFVLPF